MVELRYTIPTGEPNSSYKYITIWLPQVSATICEPLSIYCVTGDGSVSETELSESVFINGLNSRL